jgi:tRNA U34 5-carboxymethylaminomethyl modifying GTPase MnmE/TrmE
MVRFILEIIIFLLLSFIVYLISLTLPRISEEELEAIRKIRREKMIVFIEKSDLILKSFLEKFLRKVKIWLLSLNNFIEEKLSKFKKDIQKIEARELSNKELANNNEKNSEKSEK